MMIDNLIIKNLDKFLATPQHSLPIFSGWKERITVISDLNKKINSLKDETQDSFDTD